MSFIVGITGNIGSGKTTICKIFETIGVPVFYADDVAKEILNEAKIQKAIIEIFGSKVLDETHKVDKKALAQIVFEKQSELKKLNNIIHPEVYQRFSNWKKLHKKSPYLIMEAAILFESGFDKYVDFSLNIHTDKMMRLERILKRDNTDSKSVLKRMDKQFSDAKKIELADQTIHNSEKALLIPQIIELDKKFKTKKTGR